MDKAPLHCAYDNKWKGNPTDEIISQRDADHEYYTAKIREIEQSINKSWIEWIDENASLEEFKDGKRWRKEGMLIDWDDWQQLKKEMGVD